MQAILPGAPPARAGRPHTADGALIAPLGTITAAAAPRGQIAISGADPRRPGSELLVQGTAGGAFRTLLAGAPLSAPAALSSAYLGDLAFASSGPAPGVGSLRLSVERWFANTLGPPRGAGGPARGAISGLTVAMDFRSDAIVAWAQGGGVWVRDLPAGGAARRPRRLGPAGTEPRIAALLSDDDRGLVMWSQHSAATTSVWMDYSATGPSFGAPRLIERFGDPAGAPPPASPQLIRLSSESVMSAWAGAEGGHWVVRTAPIDQRGLRAVATIAAPEGDALLAALAPGPRADAVALIGERAGSGSGTQSLYAAAGTESAGRTVFSPLEPVAPAGPLDGATVAIEPGSDRAVAAWRGAGGVVYYSLRAPGPGA